MVLQRWQSLFILISTVLMCVCAFVPLAQMQTASALYQLSVMGIQSLGIPASTNLQMGEQLPSSIYLGVTLGLNILIVIFSLISIFQYKKLNLQMNMCLINAVLTIVLLVSVSIIGVSVCNILTDASFIPSPNYVLPIGAIILDIAAYSFIKKDKKVLSSYDRLR